MRSFTVGSVFGIPIKLDLTFLLILPVFAWLIGSQVDIWVQTLNQPPFTANLDAGQLTAGNTEWILGSAAAIGLFAAVVLHELGHSLVAMRYGFPIDSITLWILGGIAQLTDQPEDWKQEFLIALAGPFVSILVGVVSFAALLALPPRLDLLRFVVGYLALMNFALAAFNLLPGFPMDGGRVLRALLARRRPFAQATKIAAEVGKTFALLLGILGLFGTNIILIAIAFFIYIGASSEAQRTVMNAAFEGVRVSDVMTPGDEVQTVRPDASVADLMKRMFTERHTGYPVVDEGHLVGMITLDDVREVREVERDAYRVKDVMNDTVYTIPEYGEAMDALESMQDHGVGRLVVVDADGNLTGLVSRTDLMTAFDIIKSSGLNSSTPSIRRA